MPPTAVKGLEYYAGKKAEEVGEKGWLEVLNYLYDAAERGKADHRPFKDYVELALTLVQSASAALGEVVAQALITAVDLGEPVENLLGKFVETVGDASLIYEKCCSACGDVVVEAAVASAARLAQQNPCLAL